MTSNVDPVFGLVLGYDWNDGQCLFAIHGFSNQE